ncbi:MAG: hypothetical protein JO318_05915 [Chloroflexi bacterium]|nr:hypothetical protein [Chloroflexota bacterium]
MNLEPAEAEVVALEAAAFARALPDPAARMRYERLAESASSGVIPEDLIAPLETMLELVFDTGRPVNRAVLQSVYARTPRGRERSIGTREVNAALQSLRGHTIVELRVSPNGPSQQTFTIETERVRLQLEFDRHGAHVTSLEGG